MAVTVTNSNTIAIADPTGGAAPWSVATITTATVNNTVTGASVNTENVTYFLRGTSGLSNGAISSNYAVGADGKLAATDQEFYLPNGGLIVTYFGNEANNPLLASYAAVKTGNVVTTPGFAPANAGYRFTQYTYNPGGTLAQVVAEDYSGHFYTGV